MPVDLDDIDRRLIDLLRRDGRASYRELGRKLGVAEGTVRKRVKRLVDAGVIRRFTVELDTSGQVHAISMVSVDPTVPTPKVAERLSSLEGVEKVYEVTGQYDALVVISVSNLAELNRCIEEIRTVPGVRETNTAMILRVITAEGRSG